MRVISKIGKILTDYCENSSLVGFAYIANQKINFTERLFWLICIIISAGGSYYLIQQYEDSFDSDSISLVMEGTRPQDKTHFPTIGVCEVGDSESLPLRQYVKELYEKQGRAESDSEIEECLSRIIFENEYYSGSIQYRCSECINCEDCVKCPTSGYKELARLVRKNCSELIEFCSWNGKPFDCCNYFLPLQTPSGLCYMMNSIQTTTRNGPHWLETEFGWDAGIAELVLSLTSATDVNILNAEDVPIYMLKDQKYALGKRARAHLQLSMRNIINDLGVRDVPPKHRKCRFPNEQFKNATYDHYSFNTCISDCVKQLQLKTCGCTSYNYLVKSNDKTPSCDYHGYLCLDRSDLARPVPQIMQPWRSNGLNCKCLPSCTDHEINVFGEDIVLDGDPNKSRVVITQSASTEQFRRQAVRTRLDVVVTIGGILGLFMGASILSGIEILYFFLVRICNLKN